ncbi:MAG: sensor domain-containing diguanylate cyclase [Metallibacterium scheffleri]|uniref:GGDEF domain-containing protein n=1 Tax=Metallibacterium scheffleri TaxID=993689 RepID=UPI0026EA320E|nr:sensor domain-containing diguanylate cyclase [Metallibacterium scheffleri]MCK9367085.1 sensor domain-containing diguanylate cyclase [Metallibacterium scheffleri]
MSQRPISMPARRSSPAEVTCALRLALHDTVDTAHWMMQLRHALHAQHPEARVELLRHDIELPAPRSNHARSLRVLAQDGTLLALLRIQHDSALTRQRLATLLRPMLPGLARRLALERLHARASLADLMLDLSHVLLFEDDLDVLLAGVIAYLRERFSLSLATLILRESDTRWRLRAAAGNSTRFALTPGSLWSAQRGLTGKALRLGHTLYVPDVRDEADYVVGSTLTQAELLIPIKHAGVILGLLNLESPSAESFTAEIREVLDVLADQIGGVLHLRLLQAQLTSMNRKASALAAELARVNTRLKRSNRSLDKLSRTDELTGAKNRRGFEQALRDAWHLAKTRQQPLGMLIVDIDHFKAYNDHYGHPAGDACLSRVGALIRRALRDEDSVFARYGGEEFAIVLPGIDAAMALAVAERVRKTVFAARIVHTATPLGRISLSVGAASLIPMPKHSARLLVRLADQALYRAKHAGRNRACMAGMAESTEVATQAASTRKSSKRATT